MNLRTTKTISFEDMMNLGRTPLRILMHIDYIKLKIPKDGDIIVKISFTQFSDYYGNKKGFYDGLKVLQDLKVIEKVGPSRYKINKEVFY